MVTLIIHARTQREFAWEIKGNCPGTETKSPLPLRESGLEIRKAAKV
jgi:hypothetical protein